MIEIKEPIPYFYVTLATGNRKLFINYVHGYFRKARPDFEVVKIVDKGRFVVIRKKG